MLVMLWVQHPIYPMDCQIFILKVKDKGFEELVPDRKIEKAGVAKKKGKTPALQGSIGTWRRGC